MATYQVASVDEAEDSADQLEDDKDDNDHSILHTTEREIKMTMITAYCTQQRERDKPVYVASPPFVSVS